MILNAQRTAAVSTLAAVGLLATTALTAPRSNGGTPAAAALEQFKALAGEWVAAEDSEMARKGDLVARYTVTGDGSAVVETVFPGKAHEMITVYHAEGRDLVLTHYCVEGNQPRMRARNASGPRFDFAYDGGANIDPSRDRHMHSASIELLGADEVRSEWTEHADGKPVLVARSHIVRKTR
jgi:hypothetical protein